MPFPARTSLAVALLLASSILLSGCGGGQPPAPVANNDGNPPVVASNGESPTPVADANATPAPADPIAAEPELPPSDDVDGKPVAATPGVNDAEPVAKEAAEDLQSLVTSQEDWYKRFMAVLKGIKDKASADQANKEIASLFKEFKTLDGKFAALETTAEQRRAVKPRVRKIMNESQASFQEVLAGIGALGPDVMGALQRGPMTEMMPMMFQSKFLELGRNQEFTFADAQPDSGLTIKRLDTSGAAVFPLKLEGKIEIRRALTLSPDGRFLAGYSADNEFGGKTATFLVWDLQTGKRAYELTVEAPGGYSVNELCITARNQLIVFSSQNLHVVDLTQGEESMTVSLPDTFSCTAQCVSADGALLALTGIVGFKPKAAVLDLEKRATNWFQEMQTENVPAGALLGISPDGKHILYYLTRKAKEDENGRILRLVNAATGKTVWDKDLEETYINATFAADGSPLVMYQDRAVKLALADGAEGPPLKLQPGRGIVFSPAGGFLAGERSPAFENVKSVFVASTAGEKLFQIETAFGRLLAIDNGKHLAGANHEGELMVYKIGQSIQNGDRPPTALHTLKGHKGNLIHVAYAPDGKHIATSALDKTVRIWDAGTGKLLHTIEQPQLLAGLAFSANSKLLVTRINTKTLTLYDVETGKEKMKLDKIAGQKMLDIGVLLLAPRGGILTVPVFAAPSTIGWAVWGPGARQRVVETSDQVQFAAISPDGKLVAFFEVGKDKTVIRNLENGKVLQTLEMEHDFYSTKQPLALSSDGRLLAVASTRHLTIYEVATGKKLQEIEATKVGLALMSVAFAPDSSLVAVATNQVQFWDAKTGKNVQNIIPDSQLNVDLEFSADGKRLVTAGASGEAKIWDVESLLKRFPLK